MDHPHIFLISLETLRRDHLGCYGYARPVSPNLDRLADGGVRFRDSVANCGWTLPQHVTLHTGLYPLTHGVVLWDNPPLGPQWKLLAEHLKEHGYKTFAGVSNRNQFGGGAKYGFNRGFDEHAPIFEYNQHSPVTEEFVIERFRKNHESAPCFVYVHINDTHEPFLPPEPWYSQSGPSYHNKYEAQISYVDYYLGRIFAALKEMGLWDKMLVVAFADHGTEFWEHEFIEKKCNLYREILDVPLIFHCPERLPCGGRVVDGLVESAQVAPTILDVAGLPPLPRAQGKSLLPRVLGKSGEAPESGGAPQCVCAHTVHNHQAKFGPPQFDQWAIQTLHFKFIRSEIHANPDDLHSDWKQRFLTIMLRAGRDPSELKAGTVVRELYDLRIDPGEHRTLIPWGGLKENWPRFPRFVDAEGAKEVANDLEGKLDKWIADTRAAGQAE